MEPTSASKPEHIIKVRRMGGDLLFGPQSIEPTESVRHLKQLLPQGCGELCFIKADRELADTESLGSVCPPGVETEITAVVSRRAGDELARIAEQVKAKRQRVEARDKQWLKEYSDADEDRLKKERDLDVQEYKKAVGRLVELLMSDSLHKCRLAADSGQGFCQIDVSDLQHYELGAVFFFMHERGIRACSLMRGWFFSTQAKDACSPAAVPPVLRMGGEFNDQFACSLAAELIPRFEEQGIKVVPGECFGNLQLVWGDTEGMIEWEDQWW